MRETIIHKPWHDQPYVMVDKSAINDARLSFKAMGLLVYLIAKPAEWRVCLKHLATTHREGIDGVRSAMDELLACGYAKRTLVRNEDGTLGGTQTVISEVPFPPEDEADQATEEEDVAVGKPVDGSTDVGKSNATKERENQEKKERKTPLLKGSPKSRKESPPPTEAVLQVITHLNAVTGNTYQNTGFITARLNEGRSIEDCLLVINWIHEERRKREPEWVRDYLDPVTPFRPINFDRYLQKALRWQQDGGQESDAIRAKRVAAEVFAEYQAMQQKGRHYA